MKFVKRYIKRVKKNMELVVLVLKMQEV